MALSKRQALSYENQGKLWKEKEGAKMAGDTCLYDERQKKEKVFRDVHAEAGPRAIYTPEK